MENNSMQGKKKKRLFDSIKNLNRLNRISLPAFSASSPFPLLDPFLFLDHSRARALLSLCL
jgi:hypothetical protein